MDWGNGLSSQKDEEVIKTQPNIIDATVCIFHEGKINLLLVSAGLTNMVEKDIKIG